MSMSNKRRRRNATEAEFYVYTPGVAVPRDVTRVLVPRSVEILPDRVFAKCRRLSEVVLLASPREIGQEAFSGCWMLRRVRVRSALIEIDDGRGAAHSHLLPLRGESAFFVYAPGVTPPRPSRHWDIRYYVLVAATAEVLPADAFGSVGYAMEEVLLPEGLRKIETDAFCGCKFRRANVPSSVNRIGTSAFVSCNKLERLNFLEGVIQIEAFAFPGCPRLALRTRSKALIAVAESFSEVGGNHNFHLSTNGVIPRDDRTQVVIISDCFHSMRTGEMSAINRAIAGILRLGADWVEKCQRLRSLIAPHELRHKKEVTTLLELGLWKAKMAELGRPDRKTRDGCRLNCVASVIIPDVLLFL